MTNLLYHNNGDGSFTKITSGPVVTDRKVSAREAVTELHGYISYMETLDQRKTVRSRFGADVTFVTFVTFVTM